MRALVRAVQLGGTLTGLALASCGSTSSVYLHPGIDLTTVQRIGVLPLENLTTDRFAGDRVREILTVELLSYGVFNVADLGEVNRALRSQGIQNVAQELSPDRVTALGEALRAEALLTGSVIDYRERRTGTFTAPEVAVSLRLLDTETGTVVWSVTDARTGMSIWSRLFGVGEESLTEATQRLLREVLPTLFEEVD